jgi:uncharacterized protein
MGETGTSASAGLEDALGRAFAACPEPVLSAYLFGSHAHGRAHAESDIDVGVLLPHPPAMNERERFESRLRIASSLIGSLGRNVVDVVVLNDAPPLLARRIVTDGRRVHLRDAGADHAFVRDVQLRAADLEPFLRRAQRVKLDSLAR